MLIIGGFSTITSFAEVKNINTRCLHPT